jgi:hypothetical protein
LLKAKALRLLPSTAKRLSKPRPWRPIRNVFSNFLKKIGVCTKEDGAIGRERLLYEV